MNTKKTISFIGAGNVATHLATAFYTNGLTISKVYSRNIENAKLLADKVKATATSKITELNNEGCIYIVCVKDDVIDNLLMNFPIKNSLIAHTSGSVSMNVFEQKRFSNYGIFYPLQTFSKNKYVDIKKVPFCIEANTKENEQNLYDLAKVLTDNVNLINSEQRKHLHLAAVFACNFSNYMYTVANELLINNDMDLNLLKPLIVETANKIKDNTPKEMQTGPAKRNDKAVIEKQIQLLANHSDYKDIYQLITDNIIKDN
ncbi:MAG: DUF2520 domain-containing protein [Vicingaceae bacterium]|nr:DUF2520 domain-containing protein [Vicingaceae bacterium]